MRWPESLLNGCVKIVPGRAKKPAPRHKGSDLDAANKARADLWMDLGLVAFLIAFDVATRCLPHVPACGRSRQRAVRRPDAAHARAGRHRTAGRRDSEQFRTRGRRLRITAVVYAAITLPVLAGNAAAALAWGHSGVRGDAVVLVDLLVTHEFRVWAFGTLYPFTLQGLTQCYIAALPFLDKTVLGDLFWAAVLFGGAWLLQIARRFCSARTSQATSAIESTAT